LLWCGVEDVEVVEVVEVVEIGRLGLKREIYIKFKRDALSLIFALIGLVL